MVEPIDERPEIKKMRDEFIANLPKVRDTIVRFHRVRGVRLIRLFLISTKEIRDTLRQKRR